MKHFFHCPEPWRELLNGYRETSNVLTQEHLEPLSYVPETHSLHSATLEVDHLLVLENSFSFATHLVCMLAMIQERGRWGFDIIVWVLAKLTLDFLLSLGLTAVTDTNSGPANRSCQRTQDSLIPVSVSPDEKWYCWIWEIWYLLPSSAIMILIVWEHEVSYYLRKYYHNRPWLKSFQWLMQDSFWF